MNGSLNSHFRLVVLIQHITDQVNLMDIIYFIIFLIKHNIVLTILVLSTWTVVKRNVNLKKKKGFFY